MVAVGKGIGNGYPVSVAVIDHKTIKELATNPFKYAQSHQYDPLGAAIVEEVLQTIKDDDLIAKAEEKGPKFFLKLKSLIDNKRILDVRGRGLMFAVNLANENVGNDIFNKLLERGYIVCNRRTVLRIDPPLTITENEFEEFIEAFKEVLTN